jgi:hypothetical protein
MMKRSVVPYDHLEEADLDFAQTKLSACATTAGTT